MHRPNPHHKTDMPNLPMKPRYEHLAKQQPSVSKSTPASQHARGKRPAVAKRPANSRGASKLSVVPPVAPLSTKSIAAKEQPRDAQGRFARYGARMGAWIGRNLHRQPALTKAPAKINRPTTMKTITLTHERPIQPTKKPVKKRKPMAERGFWGKVWGLVNGDAHHEMRATNAANTRARRKAWGIEPPKKRRKRRAK